ncbi:M23 family metallopeptidase [Burkholderia sp. 8Y]|uniref:M23 family metallopeptidase n=1 Tax=Burkholderia sp. 8Y TaxID=2653133 RepID=UPI001F1B9D57|nr:M23 family metallopeptidase [Burkholderia sp. 8Y]
MLSRYGHASRICVTEGQYVMPGDEVAEVGSTGRICTSVRSSAARSSIRSPKGAACSVERASGRSVERRALARKSARFTRRRAECRARRGRLRALAGDGPDAAPLLEIGALYAAPSGMPDASWLLGRASERSVKRCALARKSARFTRRRPECRAHCGQLRARSRATGQTALYSKSARSTQRRAECQARLGCSGALGTECQTPRPCPKIGALYAAPSGMQGASWAS